MNKPKFNYEKLLDKHNLTTSDLPNNAQLFVSDLNKRYRMASNGKHAKFDSQGDLIMSKSLQDRISAYDDSICDSIYAVVEAREGVDMPNEPTPPIDNTKEKEEEARLKEQQYEKDRLEREAKEKSEKDLLEKERLAKEKSDREAKELEEKKRLEDEEIAKKKADEERKNESKHNPPKENESNDDDEDDDLSFLGFGY